MAVRDIKLRARLLKNIFLCRKFRHHTRCARVGQWNGSYSIGIPLVRLVRMELHLVVNGVQLLSWHCRYCRENVVLFL